MAVNNVRKHMVEIPCDVGDKVYYIENLPDEPVECTVTRIVLFGTAHNGIIYNAELESGTALIRVCFDDFGKTVFQSLDELTEKRKSVIRCYAGIAVGTFREKLLQCKTPEEAMQLMYNTFDFDTGDYAKEMCYMLTGMFGLYVPDLPDWTYHGGCKLLLAGILDRYGKHCDSGKH